MADSKLSICLWCDGTAEEQARFYGSLLPDGRVEAVNRSAVSTPGGVGPGDVLTAVVALGGQKILLLNGGPMFKPSEAASLMIETDDQAETDRLWDAIVDGGGQESACGWCKDRWGFSWQITPRRPLHLTTDPDANRARRAMKAMMTMRRIDIAAVERAAA